MTEPDPPKDWMEIWFETGRITWKENLLDEVEEELRETFRRLGQDPEADT